MTRNTNGKLPLLVVGRQQDTLWECVIQRKPPPDTHLSGRTFLDGEPKPTPYRHGLDERRFPLIQPFYLDNGVGTSSLDAVASSEIESYSGPF